MRFRFALGGFALLVAVLFAGGGASLSPAFAQAPVPALAWTDCGNGFQCATMKAPLDYASPNGQQIDLALVRLPASGGGQRIGSLFVNPGGPGASGVDFARGWARTLDPAIRARFDIVGFDPRGTGTSTPIVCHDTLQQYVGADPSPDSQAEWDALVNAYRTFTSGCATKYPTLLPHVGTRDVARDLDRMREAVGDAQLTYVGYSYGTVIGQVYADLFPARVRALVLDGAVDLSLSTDERNLQQAVGFERALASFEKDCVATTCVLAQGGNDPEQAVRDVMARTEQARIPSKSADRALGPGDLLYGLAAPLYDAGGWPSLARAIESALEGDGSALVKLSDSYLRRNPDGSYPNLTEANLAINCIDQGPSAMPTDFAAYPAAAAAFAAKAPHFGPAFASVPFCAFWPVPPQPLTAPKAVGAPPILVVSTVNDPATPYEWGVAVAKQLPGAALLTYGGEGHTAYTHSDGCVDDAVNDYLLTLALPAEGAFCGDASLRPAPTPTPRPNSGNVTSPSATPAPPSSGDADNPLFPAPTSRDGGSSVWKWLGPTCIVGALLMFAWLFIRARSSPTAG